MSKAYSYYKLLITDFRRGNNQQNFANLAEFRIYDKDGNNIAKQDGAVYSASSYVSNAKAEYAFDDNASTIWHTVWDGSLASTTNWLQVQLKAPASAVSISIVATNERYLDFINTFSLYGSEDGQTWDVLLEQSGIYSIWTLGGECAFQIAAGPEKRYLIQDATTIYTVTDSVLEDLQTTTITAELFQTHGMEEPPTSEIVLTLTNPKVIAWSDDELPEITAIVTATPYPQTLYSPDYDMTDPTILGIEKVITVASDDVTFAISFDGGETWKYYTGTDWATLSEETSGMSAETIMSVPTDKWAEVATTGTFKVRATLPSITSTLESFVVDYLNS